MMDIYSHLRLRLERQYGTLSARLMHAFTSVIEDGVLHNGEALPPERELAAALSVSRSTLRQCFKELSAQGLIVTRPGAGTVVSSVFHKPIAKLSGFTEDMKTRGLEPASRVLVCRIGPVPPETAFRTGLPLGTPTMTLARLRQAGGETLSYERSIVPVSSVGEDYDGSGSLYARMDAVASRPRRILQSLKAVEADPETAELIGIRPGAAVLEIARVGYDANGLAVEDAISWYRGDRYQYVGEIFG